MSKFALEFFAPIAEDGVYKVVEKFAGEARVGTGAHGPLQQCRFLVPVRVQLLDTQVDSRRKESHNLHRR